MAAKNAGMRVIAITTTQNAEGISCADMLIRDFDDLVFSN